MKKVNVSEARANLSRLLDEVAESHEPVIITRNRSNGVLIAEGDCDLPPLTRPLTLGKSWLLFCEILPGSDLLNRCAV